jgi:hypothetical protein
MKAISAVAILFFGACVGVLIYFDPGPKGLYDIYSNKLQTPLFTGFLTIGGFLLTLKTFVLIKLKESLYGSEFYQSELADKRHLNPNLSTYGPLSRLGHFLIVSVVSALITATAQLSVGFIHHTIAAAVCMGVAATTLLLVFVAWWEIRKNLSAWFSLLEREDAHKRAAVR